MVDVFPAPLGPSSPKHSPSLIERHRLRTATLPDAYTLRSEIASSGLDAGGGPPRWPAPECRHAERCCIAVSTAARSAATSLSSRTSTSSLDISSAPSAPTLEWRAIAWRPPSAARARATAFAGPSRKKSGWRGTPYSRGMIASKCCEREGATAEHVDCAVVGEWCEQMERCRVGAVDLVDDYLVEHDGEQDAQHDGQVADQIAHQQPIEGTREKHRQRDDALSP
eukprot:5066981-Prymnesium_polylepis.2